jgi:hypothetical protein
MTRPKLRRLDDADHHRIAILIAALDIAVARISSQLRPRAKTSPAARLCRTLRHSINRLWVVFDETRWIAGRERDTIEAAGRETLGDVYHAPIGAQPRIKQRVRTLTSALDRAANLITTQHDAR